MRTALYVFSATGNCLTTARELARRLGDCRIVSVAWARKQPRILEDAEQVGFVFPVYYGNMPYPVREVVAKMVLKAEAHVFTVTTCRGHVGAANQRMDQLLRTRGQKLSLALGIPMPGNSYLSTPEEERVCLAQQKERIEALLEPIRNRQIQDCFQPELLPLTPVDYPNNFRGIVAEASCIGCGTCVSVCPQSCIDSSNTPFVIDPHHCLHCGNCVSVCPVSAVERR